MCLIHVFQIKTNINGNEISGASNVYMVCILLTTNEKSELLYYILIKDFTQLNIVTLVFLKKIQCCMYYSIVLFCMHKCLIFSGIEYRNTNKRELFMRAVICFRKETAMSPVVILQFTQQNEA